MSEILKQMPIVDYTSVTDCGLRTDKGRLVVTLPHNYRITSFVRTPLGHSPFFHLTDATGYSVTRLSLIRRVPMADLADAIQAEYVKRSRRDIEALAMLQTFLTGRPAHHLAELRLGIAETTRAGFSQEMEQFRTHLEKWYGSA
jgi:hypothetical protein